jgi:hypothetical protein
MKISIYFAVFAISFLLVGSSAMAQQGPVAGACAADIKSLCSDVKPGDGRIRDCVKAHFADLSASCKSVLSKARTIGAACGTDVKTLCADVKPGGGRIVACMKSHMAEVSLSCKDAVSNAGAGKS